MASSKHDLNVLLSQLTLEEKISLTAGKDFWTTADVSRLGIPSLKTTDGPNGARGTLFKGGVTAACFPASVCIAATFDRALAGRVGGALAEEARSKGAACLLGPTVCPHRDPRGGRNFESFSEDPYLAGELASEFINGLQREGVGACIKHYAVNEQETNRFTVDARVSQGALREIYLKPFEIAIKKSSPWAIMTSYNLVNGTHADMNKFLLETVLRGEWGFDGLVMSDWGGTNSVVESLKAGLDLEMPGPPLCRTVAKVTAAINDGQLSTETLDKRVMKNLEHLLKAANWQPSHKPEEKAVDRLETRQLIRQAGCEGIVLLKNQNQCLPLQTDKVESIAMIGLAREYLGHGGGSAAVNSHHKISAYQAFEEEVGGSIKLNYAEGARISLSLDPFEENVVDDMGEPGFTVRLAYGSVSPKTETLKTPRSNFQSIERPGLHTVELMGTFTPDVTGHHYISFSTVGNTTVYINDEIVYEVKGSSGDAMAFLAGTVREDRKQHPFVAGEQYRIHIEATASSDTSSGISILAHPLVGFNLGFAAQEALEADLHSPAIDAALSSEVAIIFAGHTTVWETEGVDRESINLPMEGSFDRLIADVAAVNSQTIVVISTGSPIAMPWLSDVAAVVQAWFPGQEAGYSVSDIIFGHVNPCGKLPMTYPRAITDVPAYNNFPGDQSQLRVDYKEDVFVGYRYYDENPQAILFPFGFGLSYTSFRISEVSLSSALFSTDLGITVNLSIENEGSRNGSEVVQAYVGYTEAQTKKRPRKGLAGFVKTRELQPGQWERCNIHIDSHQLAYWNENRYKWIVDSGKYMCYVGTSCREGDGRGNATLYFDVCEEFELEP